MTHDNNQGRESDAATASENYGPLGPGHDVEKDPLAGIRGVMAGTLILEAITFGLALTVLFNVDEGKYSTGWRITYISVLAIAVCVAAFLQKKPWAIELNLILQVFAVASFVVHPAVGIIGVIFALVWWYILSLRKNLIERQKRGLLPAQHM